MTTLTMADIYAAHHAESVALRTLQKTRADGWAGFSWQMLNGGCEVRVAPARLVKTGKKKGRMVFGKPHERVVMTEAQILEEAQRFEAAGQCAKCAGDGKRVLGWSLKEGTKHGPCSRCGGSGKAPA